jgi:hypothetical protein
VLGHGLHVLKVSLWWVRAATVGAADSLCEANSNYSVDSVDSLNEFVVRAFHPIVPHSLSLIGLQRDVGGVWKPLHPLDTVAVSADGPKVTVGVGTSETKVCA